MTFTFIVHSIGYLPTLHNIPSFTVYCWIFLTFLFVICRRLNGFVGAFRSSCEEGERINQSATCLFNVNDLLSTCPSADCNWQTDFDRKLLLADCLSCVLSASDHHFSFCSFCKWKWKTKREGKKGVLPKIMEWRKKNRREIIKKDLII